MLQHWPDKGPCGLWARARCKRQAIKKILYKILLMRWELKKCCCGCRAGIPAWQPSRSRARALAGNQHGTSNATFDLPAAYNAPICRGIATVSVHAGNQREGGGGFVGGWDTNPGTQASTPPPVPFPRKQNKNKNQNKKTPTEHGGRLYSAAMARARAIWACCCCGVYDDGGNAAVHNPQLQWALAVPCVILYRAHSALGIWMLPRSQSRLLDSEVHALALLPATTFAFALYIEPRCK
jgi:hypothetical protein